MRVGYAHRVRCNMGVAAAARDRWTALWLFGSRGHSRKALTGRWRAIIATGAVFWWRLRPLTYAV